MAPPDPAAFAEKPAKPTEPGAFERVSELNVVPAHVALFAVGVFATAADLEVLQTVPDQASEALDVPPRDMLGLLVVAMAFSRAATEARVRPLGR